MDLNKKFDIKGLKVNGNTVIEFMDRNKGLLALGGGLYFLTKASSLGTILDSSIMAEANRVAIRPMSTLGIHIPKWFMWGVPAIIVTGATLCALLKDDEFSEKYGSKIADITLVGGIALMYIICFKL